MFVCLCVAATLSSCSSTAAAVTNTVAASLPTHNALLVTGSSSGRGSGGRSEEAGLSIGG